MAGGRGKYPSFAGRQGGGRRPTSLRPRDADSGNNGGRGSWGKGRGRSHQNTGTNATDPAAQPQNNVDLDALDEKLGYVLHTEAEEKLGWLLNFSPVTVKDKDSNRQLSAINCYFICQDGGMFRVAYTCAPYFYLQIKNNLHLEVDAYLRRKYEGAIKDTDADVCMEDLDLKNHLSGLKRRLLKVSFYSVQDLINVKTELMHVVRRNKAAVKGTDAYKDQMAEMCRHSKDVLEAIEDMREYDVPYHVRIAIDTDLRCAQWYNVKNKLGRVELEHRPDLLQRAEPRIVAWDIETTKLPLQFPNSEYDQVFMISYMIDKTGYLICNREVVGGDISDFEYSPKPEYEGPFVVFNEPNEEATLRKFFQHMQELQPAIHVTYNGDFFDWPFVETRAAKYDMDMLEELGFKCKPNGGECISRCSVHMDCLHWVNRDSYLPQGSRGLKAVCKAKLGYDPVEIDPELMVQQAAEDPQAMASYSVSDAVATFYLYMTYIHPFIFSLSTIIPMPPDEVLRKGSGTLCEMLLMVEAKKANVVCPNKASGGSEAFYNGHLLESQTYIGGKVEALESGVFRSDIPCKFKCQPEAYQERIDNLDTELSYAIEVENQTKLSDVTNYAEVRDDIKAQLEDLRDVPNREECPLIYHLDVAAMYPNIILTNRLQPSAIVQDEDCAACDFNKPGKNCLRKMDWIWKGEHYSASRAEYYSIKAQLEIETFPPLVRGGPARTYRELPYDEQQKVVKDRLKKYSQKVYKQVLERPAPETRTAGICMRENSFYVDTVLAFRDRRYEYKGLNKKWKGKLDEAKASNNPLKIVEASDMVVLYDSLQLAHKCILNSFYGYVMRKGARWYSMEMAGVVTHTGANIIQRANTIICRLGRTLELDTDGIWCALPGSFPENFKLTTKSGKTLKISYPCVMLNAMVAQHNTNDQYANLVDTEAKRYEVVSKMTIEFEVDGPYKAMILPASKEEGKSIKKRYAVFNLDGTLAELKGFELKRRGELKLVKVFQSEVFGQFLEGETLQECYNAVAAVANRWLDLLDSQGGGVTDEELLSYISESSVMSKAVDEYEGRKSCAITTANRLGQFLGDQRIKDKGLVCNYIVAQRPDSLPTSERAVPVAIFSTEPAVARAYLRKWCGDVPVLEDGRPDIRAIIDWAYYKERLGSAIMKIITIPAAMQRVPNPVPRVKHPDWLNKAIREHNDTAQQLKLTDMFKSAAQQGAEKRRIDDVDDMEDFGLAKVQRLADGAPGIVSGGGNNDGQAGNGLAQDREQDVEAADEGYCAAEQENHSPPVNAQQEREAATEPDIRQDYRAWLVHRKQVWRAARARRKAEAAAVKRRGLPGGAAGLPTDAASTRPAARNVAAILMDHNTRATSRPWQLLQIASTGTAGQFKVWAHVAGMLYSVHVRVPRCYYVNSRLAPDDPATAAWGPKVHRKPYGEKELYNLYQCSIDELDFRKQHGAIAAALNASKVEAVYESQMPLIFEVELALGCCVSVAPSALQKAVGADTFELQDLQYLPTPVVPYLDLEGAPGVPSGTLRHCVLFGSLDAAGNRGILLLFMPAKQRAQVVILQSSVNANSREVSASAAQRLWVEAWLDVADDAAQDAPQLVMDVQYARSVDAAMVAMQQALADARGRLQGSLTVLALELPAMLSRAAASALHALQDFPTVQVQAKAEDSAYPALLWQSGALRTAFQRALLAAPWLQERLGVAAYAHLPIGSLGQDWILDTADALMARRCRDDKCLLWTVDSSVPPLIADAEAAGLPTNTQTSKPAELTCSGVYRSVCVRLKMQHLAVAAIVQSALLADMEQAGLGDNSSGTAAAFRALVKLVGSWLVDALEHGNDYADTLLHNVYRWLSSQRSRMYSNALHQHVMGLMNKMLLQLVAEMRRLGATLVHADHTTLILCTGKSNLSAAIGYTDYLLAAIRGRELFKWISMTPTTIWYTLAFLDPFNLAGLLAAVPQDVKEAMTNNPGSLSESNIEAVTQESASQLSHLDAVAGETCSTALDHYWTIKDYLPKACQQLFMQAVTEFVFLPWKTAQESVRDSRGASQGGTQAVQEAREQGELQLTWLRHNIPHRLTPTLIEQLRALQRMVAHEDASDADVMAFPQLPGSYLSEAQLGSPALALVRSLCHVFSLDASVEEDTTAMRRQLLRLLHVPEFSPASQWVDPCRHYVLQDVICQQCSDCRDLDLCRDASLLAHTWTCAACSAAYDLGAIQQRLLQHVRHLEVAYAVQDLKCGRCKQVANKHCQCSCEFCGGELVVSITPEQQTSKLRVLHSIGQYHNLEMLSVATGRLLGKADANTMLM